MENKYLIKNGKTKVSLDYLPHINLTNIKIVCVINGVRMVHVEPVMVGDLRESPGKRTNDDLAISAPMLCRVVAQSVESMRRHLMSEGPDNPEKTPAEYDEKFIEAKRNDTKILLQFVNEWHKYEHDIFQTCQALNHPILAMRGECLCGQTKDRSFPDDETIEKFPESKED